MPEDALANLFKMETAVPGPTLPTCFIFSTKRDKHIPVLHIRDARYLGFISSLPEFLTIRLPFSVNDNDDLIPLFNSYTEILKLTYGDFYVAEMIEAQNENNKCLAAEAQGLAVGFMAITTDVNLPLLNKCFELRSFHGLHKQTDHDITRPPTPPPEPTPPQLHSPQVSSSHNASSQRRYSSVIQDSATVEESQKLSSLAADAIDA